MMGHLVQLTHFKERDVRPALVVHALGSRGRSRQISVISRLNYTMSFRTAKAM